MDGPPSDRGLDDDEMREPHEQEAKSRSSAASHGGHHTAATSDESRQLTENATTLEKHL
jgi:hypothetical protein